MYDKKALIAIKSGYDHLTKAEKKVADYILKNLNTVVSKSASDIANDAGVAKSAVVRCCKSLGFEGFSELKLSLAVELSKNKQLNFVPYIAPEDEESDILDKIFSANVKTLHDTADKIDRGVLKSVVRLLSEAENIYIYGIGTSAIMVNDFQYRLMQLGRHANCFTDVPAMKISTLNIKDGDVAFGISHSGRTVATVDVLKLAKERGAKTMCLTSYPKSKITKVSDYPLCVYSDEVSYPAEAVSARVAHMSVLDSIAIAISAGNYDQTLKRSRKTHELINTIRYER